MRCRRKGEMTMQFNVSGLLKGPVGDTREYDFEERVLEHLTEDTELVRPISGHVQLMRTQNGILVTGTVHTRAEMVCSRCLEPAYYDLDIHIEEEYYPTVEVYTGAALPWREFTDDEALLIDAQHILDITEVVRQDLIISLPMKPLCSENCKGLCPVCGANLNEGPHECEEEEIDPRWAALVGFKVVESP